MKIRIIQAAQADDNGQPIKYRKLFLPFNTIATLAGLTPDGIDVELTDDYVQKIDFDEKVDLVAITAQTSQAPRAYAIADEYRKRGVHTVMGGFHASACPQEALEHVDAVVVGEAEPVWDDLIRDAKNNDLQRIYQMAQPSDLSRPVIPRYDLVDFSNYVVPPFAKTPLISIQTARGCPFACDFCAVSAITGRNVRTKPIVNVLREIEAVKPSRVFFADDNIIADPLHARELFEAVRPLKKRWACQMSTTAVKHPELIDLAAEAGCHETFVGVESLDQESLKTVNKGFNKVSKYAELFSRLRSVGILAQASIILGFDNDTPESIRRMIDVVMEWDINYLYIFVMTPLPGTPLYKRMKEQNRIVDTNWSHYDCTRCVIQPKKMSQEQLNELVWESYQRFYAKSAIAKRFWRFKWEYTRFFPRDMAVEELFFQLHCNRAVGIEQHPFSLGLGA